MEAISRWLRGHLAKYQQIRAAVVGDRQPMKAADLTIGVVGVCGSGKSSLARRLKKRGYTVRHIAQEHSYTPDMWQRLIDPDVLIFLEVSYPLTMKRKNFSWSEGEYQQQLKRLQHAYTHADLRINTNSFTPDEVLAQVQAYLDSTQST